MDAVHFDNAVRSLMQRLPRSLHRGLHAEAGDWGSLLTRRLVLGSLGSPLALGTVCLPDAAIAKKKRRRKRRRNKKNKVKLNEFGCVDVGSFCKNGSQCCSGICEGKTCRAHDSGTGCGAGVPEVLCGGTDIKCATATGGEGICEKTTGNAGYCTAGFKCFPCRTDVDCQAGCGPAAACLRCAPFCTDTGGTACGNPDLIICPA